MSLYNMLFGTNPLADILLEIVGLTRGAVGRFRDAYIHDNGNILVYTRNGGGNREHYDFDDEDSEGGVHCDCTGCVIEYRLPAHPNYVTDYDDDFDCTYASVEFSVPEASKPLVEMLRGISQEDSPKSVGEKFNTLIENMKEGAEDEETKRAMAIGKKIVSGIEAAINKEES